MITGEVVKIEVDQVKNLNVWVQFKKDGVEIPFWKGGELLIRDGKKVWPFMTHYQKLINKTPEEIQTWIEDNIRHQIGNVITVITAPDVRNADAVSKLQSLVGLKFQDDKVAIQIDETHTVTLKDDGSLV